MNLEVTDNNLYLFLPGKIARMIQICPVTLLQTSQPNCGIMIPQPYEEFMEEENVNKNNQL